MVTQERFRRRSTTSPSVESVALRPRLARQIKAAIGGTERTALVSPTTIIVYSSWVINATTEEQRQELRHAILRVAGERAGSPAPPIGLATTLITDRLGLTKMR